jgi:hypothetical protein
MMWIYGEREGTMAIHRRPRMAGILLIASASAGLLAGLAGSQDTAADRRLPQLLAKARVYCLKLETAALDFTCLEKIEERTYPLDEILAEASIMDSAWSGKAGDSYAVPRQKNYYTHTYVYDYQFVRKADRKIEKRTLLEEDGRKTKTDDAELATTTVRVQNALFGPVGLLGESAQSGHDYRIAAEESRKGRKVVIVEAVPKPGLERQHCYGRIWMHEDDGSIVKISWDQTSVGNFQMVRARAQEIGAEPQLSSITEYGLEKNGLRFPSQDTTEEAYLKGGAKLVKSLTTIVYKDYKFFTVETVVQY